MFTHPKSRYFISIGSCAFLYNAEKCLDLIKRLGYKFEPRDVCSAIKGCSLSLIQKFCDDIILDNYEKSFESFQCEAAQRGSLDILKYLYSKGLPFGKDKHGRMPILRSAENGNIDCFKFLAEVTNFGDYPIEDFISVGKEAAKKGSPQIIDFMYDNYPDQAHRDSLKPIILLGDELQSYIKVYGTSDITEEDMISLAKSDSSNIISYAIENGIKMPVLSLEELSHYYCPKSIVLLTKGREKEAFTFLVQKKCFANCVSLLDVIDLTPQERGFAIQQFTPEQLSPYNAITKEFNKKILSGDAEIEGTDVFLFLLSTCYYVPDDIAREYRLFERYPHTPREYYDHARSPVRCVVLMIKNGLSVSDLLDKSFMKDLVMTELRQPSVEPIVEQMKDPKQCLLWAIEFSGETAFTYREIIYAFLKVRPELRTDADVIKAVQNCEPGWDSTPLFMEFKVGICPALIGFFQREHESPSDYDYVFQCLTNDEKKEILFSATFFGSDMLEWGEPTMRYKGETLMHNFIRRGRKFLVLRAIEKGVDLSFAENEGDDPIIFEILKSEYAGMYKEAILERSDLLALTNREGKTVNEVLEGIESKSPW